MMPPISGIQAIAAATFEGKPVAVEFGPGSGPGLGGGGGAGCSSGITYIHKMAVALSSNLAFAALFCFRSRPSVISCAPNDKIHDQEPPPCCPRFHPDRVTRRNRGHRHLARDRGPGSHKRF